MSPKPSIVAPIVASLFGLALALGAVEAGVRILVPMRSETGPGWSDRPRFYFRAASAPSMQDYPHEPKKPANTWRVAVIGDSFTFAPYMQFTDTFPKKLEQMLNTTGSSRRAQVLNLGVPAYSTSHEVPVARAAISEGADLIILQITLNDPEIKHHTPSGITANAPDRFGQLNLTGRLGWLASHWRTLGFVLTRLHNSETHRAYVEYFNGLFSDPRSWKQFQDSMSAIVSLSREAGTPVVAVVFPLFGLPMDERYPFYPLHSKVNDFMRSLGVPVLDVSPIYKGIPLDHLQVLPGVDRHPNEIAHRMAAEEIYLWLEEQRLLPEDLVIKDKFATRLGVSEQRPWAPTPPGHKE